MPTTRFLFVVLLAAVALSACATYRPAPISPEVIALEYQTRHFDTDAIHGELARLVPNYMWNGNDWNRVTLLAAALANNPEIASARARVLSTKADIVASGVRTGPNFTLSAEYALNPTEASSWLLGAAGDLLVDENGRRLGRIEAAEIAARLAEFDYAATIWSVRMALRRAVDVHAIAQREVTLSDELLGLRQRQIEIVRRRVDAGEVSRQVLDLVRADLAFAANRKSMASAAVETAGLDLAVALGVAPDVVDLTHLEPLSGNIAKIASPSEDDQADALRNRTEILAAIAGYDQAEISLKTAFAAQYSNISVGPGYTWERGLSKLPFALNLAFPSSDFGKAEIEAAEAKRAEAARQLEAAVAAVLANIDRADAEYRATWDALSLVRLETLPIATAIAQQAERAIMAGSIDRSEWAASQAGLLTARLDELTTLQNLLQAEAALEDALRRPLYGPELEMNLANKISPEGPRL